MVALEDDGLRNIGKFIEDYLYLFGIDVLSVLGQDHVLGPAEQENVVVLVHGADVAGAEPSVLENLCRSLGILVIAAEHDVTLDIQFSGDMLRIRRVNSEFHHFGDVFAAGLGNVLPELSVGDDRSQFRQTVAGDERYLQFVDEKRLYLGRDGGTSGGEDFDIASHRSHQLVVQHLAELGVVLVVGQFRLSFRRVDIRTKYVFREFYENERDSVEDIGLDIHQRLLDIHRDWRNSQHSDVHTDGKRDHHVAHKTEAVSMREKAQIVSSPVEREAGGDSLDVGGVIAVSQHHALWVAGRAGSIEDGADIVEIDVDDAEIGRLHTFGILLCEEPGTCGVDSVHGFTAGENLAGDAVDDAENLGHLLEVHGVECAFLGIEDFAV